jgi:N-acyl-D-aspartate/D-glutamate deacylase
VKELAAFASSDAGKVFARIEERFGRDPAAFLEPLDDVLAHNLRAAFVVTLTEDSEETDEHRLEMDRLRRVGEQLG